MPHIPQPVIPQPGMPQPNRSPGIRAQLDALYQSIAEARSLPMSASAVINRSDTLAAIEKIVNNLPTDDRPVSLRSAEAEAGRIVSNAREQAIELVKHTSIVKQAELVAARLKAESEHEAEQLRTETDRYVDAQMAAFESVLHKTVTQVRTARQRLSERSRLDEPGQ